MSIYMYMRLIDDLKAEGYDLSKHTLKDIETNINSYRLLEKNI